MRVTRHEQFSYTDSTLLASLAIDIFYNDEGVFEEFWDMEKESIIPKLLAPQRETVIHLYLDHIESNTLDIRNTLNNLGLNEYESYLLLLEKMLSESGIKTNRKVRPNYNAIEKCEHCGNCKSCTKLQEYIKWLGDRKYEVRPKLIHSAFHILMLNKGFLRDVHEEIATYLEYENNELQELYPDKIKPNGTIRRVAWNSWLKKGIFFRDKGICTICRNPITGDLFLGLDPNVDHIVPLAKFGSNDSSNLQTLCHICNNKKRHYSSKTSSYDIPLWNLED